MIYQLSPPVKLKRPTAQYNGWNHTIACLPQGGHFLLSKNQADNKTSHIPPPGSAGTPTRSVTFRTPILDPNEVKPGLGEWIALHLALWVPSISLFSKFGPITVSFGRSEITKKIPAPNPAAPGPQTPNSELSRGKFKHSKKWSGWSPERGGEPGGLPWRGAETRHCSGRRPDPGERHHPQPQR